MNDKILIKKCFDLKYNFLDNLKSLKSNWFDFFKSNKKFFG